MTPREALFGGSIAQLEAVPNEQDITSFMSTHLHWKSQHPHTSQATRYVLSEKLLTIWACRAASRVHMHVML